LAAKAVTALQKHQPQSMSILYLAPFDRIFCIDYN